MYSPFITTNPTAVVPLPVSSTETLTKPDLSVVSTDFTVAPAVSTVSSSTVSFT